jgi:hypothetical protein
MGYKLPASQVSDIVRDLSQHVDLSSKVEWDRGALSRLGLE